LDRLGPRLEGDRRATAEHHEDLVLFDIAHDARGDLPDPDLRAVDGRAESRPADARGARHALLAADRFVLELYRIRVVQLAGPHESNPKPRASSVRSSRL